jgi:hypothetical protein
MTFEERRKKAAKLARVEKSLYHMFDLRVQISMKIYAAFGLKSLGGSSIMYQG